MAQWHVYLYGILWDDGKGEYDTSELPENLRVTVNAEDRSDAIEFAMSEASNEFGSLIEGTEQIETTKVTA